MKRKLIQEDDEVGNEGDENFDQNGMHERNIYKKKPVRYHTVFYITPSP
jgi:hypothetical protein